MFSIRRLIGLNDLMSLLCLKATSYVEDEDLGIPVCSDRGSQDWEQG